MDIIDNPTIKSGIKVLIHKETGKIALNWQVYAALEYDNKSYPQIELKAYQYVGEALENENGLTCVFHERVLEDFEFIGFV